MPSKFLISIIDDDERFREAVTSLVKSRGFAVKAFASAIDFWESPVLGSTSCLITDINMPGMTGIELHSRLVQAGYAIPTILLTAYPDESIRTHMLEAGCLGYLSKPFDDEVLIEYIGSALRARGSDQDLS